MVSSICAEVAALRFYDEPPIGPSAGPMFESKRWMLSGVRAEAAKELPEKLISVGLPFR